MTSTTFRNGHLDATDAKRLHHIVESRETGRLDRPHVGDAVRFTDGVTRWLSHDHGPEWGIQTCVNGSFYLHDSGGLDFSGSLDPCVKYDTLTDTGETTYRSAWFFHHGRAAANNGVTFDVPVRVWQSSQTSVEAGAARACTGCGTPVHGYPTWKSSLDRSTALPRRQQARRILTRPARPATFTAGRATPAPPRTKPPGTTTEGPPSDHRHPRPHHHHLHQGRSRSSARTSPPRDCGRSTPTSRASAAAPPSSTSRPTTGTCSSPTPTGGSTRSPGTGRTASPSPGSSRAATTTEDNPVGIEAELTESDVLAVLAERRFLPSAA